MSSGQLLGGDRLLPAALAEQIGVSIIPVREAIGQLLSEGLLEQLPRRGVFVRQPNREELIELLEFRKILECSAAAQAARRIGDAELSKLAKHLHEFQAAQTAIIELASSLNAENNDDGIRQPPPDAIMDAFARPQLSDLSFHLTILRAARNRWVLKSMEDTNMMIRMFGYRTDWWDDCRNFAKFIAESIEIHQSIYSAIRSHDPKAARQAMVLHMRRARRNMLARFDRLRAKKNGEEAETREFTQSFRERLYKAQNLRIDDEHG
ncbi:MAG: GntR family transcriptional regulator [Pirellulales bacterium]|nr:GntR family transcriptional regulator [Pirellulales bacterium]